MKLHLGAGKSALPGWTNIDQVALPGIDLIFNLEDCATKRLPFDDNSVDELRASHVLEHVHNILPLMQELHRVTKPGGQFFVQVPYGASDDAYENPTHIRFMYPGSFMYFSQPIYWREDYGYRGDWSTELRLFIYPEVFDELGGDQEKIVKAIRRERNIVLEMQAFLTCVKPIRPMDRALITPLITDILRAQ